MSEEIKNLMKKVGCVHRVLVEANHKTRGELKSIGKRNAPKESLLRPGDMLTVKKKRK